MKDFYKILECAYSATDAELKKAHRRLSKMYHPDLNPNDKAAEEKYKCINEAYQNIIEQRKNGNFSKDNKSHGQNVWTEDWHSNPYDPFTKTYKGRKSRHPDQSIEDLIKDIQEKTERFKYAQTYSDKPIKIEVDRVITISLLESIFGCVKHVHSAPGLDSLIAITIPPGTLAETIIKYSDLTLSQFETYDLKVRILVHPDQKFTPNNSNLHASCPISIWQALVGGKIHFETIDKHDILVTIPPNLKIDSSLRINGQGGFNPLTKSRGDLILKLDIFYPELTEEQKQVIQKWI